MYDPPSYLWAITIAGMTAMPVATCVVLYGGAVRASLGRRRAAISELPLALIPTAAVPLLFVLHITSVSALVRAPRTPLPATAPLTAAAK